MHVLIIPSWYPEKSDDIGGSFFREQALALQKHGQKIGVIHPQLRSMRRWDSVITGPKGLKIENDMGMPTYRHHGMAWLPRLPYASSWLWVWHGLKLFDSYVKEHGLPDIVHAQSLLNGGLLANEIYQRFNIPFVVTEHSSAFVTGLIEKWQKTLAAKVASNALARLTVSESFAKIMSSFFDKDITWKYVPNVLSAQFENASILVKDLQKDTFTFCHVSLLTAKKGVDLLINAFASAFAGRNDVLLVIGGDGVERSRLEKLVRDLGMSNQIKFLGMLNRDQVLDVMAKSDAFVLPSHIETFGVVLIEALALGKPVIATRCGGPESIVRKQDGFLIPKNNVAELATAMRQMRESYDQFDPAQIRQSCLDRFSEKVVISQLVHIYQRILLKIV